MTHTPTAAQPATTMSTAAKVYVVAAIIEAITWAGLLVGMYFKHIDGSTDLGVTIFGRLHGAAFILYLVATVAVAKAHQWKSKPTVIALVAAVPPLLTVPAEMWLRRHGYLHRSAEAPAQAKAG